MDLSPEQAEAQTIGAESRTIEYLNQHPLIAIILFSFAIVSGVLWATVVVTAAEEIYDWWYRRPREKIPTYAWVIIALLWALMTWILVRYAFGLPVTAIFSL